MLLERCIAGPELGTEAPANLEKLLDDMKLELCDIPELKEIPK